MATVLTIGTQSRIRTGDTVTVALPAGKTAADFRTNGATVRAFGTSYPVTPTLSGSEVSFAWPAPQLRGGAEARLQLEAPVVSAGGGPGLSASATSYLASVSAGALIATMTDPYSGLGLGVTTYVAASALPGQLALSGGTIVAGLTAPVAGTSYEAKIRAISGDGRREVSETIGFTATAAPAPTPTPSAQTVVWLDDGGASAGLWYGANAGPAWAHDAARGKVLGVVQRFNYNGGAPLKENTALIYDMATRTATIGGVIMTDDSTIVGSADQHGVGVLCQDTFGNWHSYGGNHNGPMKHSVSLDGGLTWAASGTFGTSYTYAHPVQVGSDQWVYAREAPGGNTYPLVFHKGTAINSTTGAMTFGSKFPLIDLENDTRCYAGPPQKVGADIYVVLCRANAADSIRRDVYIGVHNTVTGAFRNLAGTVSVAEASLPVLRTGMDASFRVVDQTTAGTEEGNTPDMFIDAEGIHLTYQGGVGGTTQLYLRLALNGTVLEGPTAVGTVSYRYATAGIGPRPGGGVEILFPKPAAVNDYATQAAFTRGGDIYRVERPAGGAWSAETLVKSCTGVAPLDSVTRVKDGPADFRFAFAERAIDDNDFTTGGTLRSYGWGAAGMLTTPFVEDADAAAHIGGAAYTADQRVAVTNYFRGAKRVGWWGKVDEAHLMLEPFEEVARKSIYGGFVLTDTAPGVTYTPTGGIKPTSTAKVGSLFNPSNAAGKRLATTSVNLCIVPTENVQSSSSDLGTTAATATLALGSRGGTGNSSTLLVDITAVTRAVGTANLLIMSQRSGTSKALYVRGKGVSQTGSAAATSLPDGTLTLGGNGAGFSQRGLGYAHIGAAIDVGPLMQIVKRYLSDRGAL